MDCYLQLRASIASGELSPGTPLVESALGTQFGVSRTPVRESLKRLEQDGLVVRVGSGYRIRQYQPQEILDIYEARIALEATAAASAARRASAYDLARLSGIQSDPRPELSVGVVNREWHAALVDAAHNHTISSLLANLLLHLEISHSPRLTGSDNVSEVAAEHQRIFEAVEHRDGVAAHDLMVTHLSRIRDLRMHELAEVGHHDRG